MNVKELKEICISMHTKGLIDEFKINANGMITGTDAGKTIVTTLTYNKPFEKNICLGNIKGIIDLLDKFNADNTTVEFIDNKIYITDGIDFANIILKDESNFSKFNVPEINESDYHIVLKNVAAITLNKLGKMRPDSLINEIYYLYMDNNNLMFRVGEDNESNIGGKIGTPDKYLDNTAIKFTMNISECFKSVTSDANIYIVKDTFMRIEYEKENYIVNHYLAPRVESN